MQTTSIFRTTVSLVLAFLTVIGAAGILYIGGNAIADYTTRVSTLQSETQSQLEELKQLVVSQKQALEIREEFDLITEYEPAPSKQGYHACLRDRIHEIRQPNVDPRYFGNGDRCYPVEYSKSETFSVSVQGGVPICDTSGRTFFSYSSLARGQNAAELGDSLSGFNPSTLVEGRFYQFHAPLLGKTIFVRFDGTLDNNYAKFSLNIPKSETNYCVPQKR